MNRVAPKSPFVSRVLVVADRARLAPLLQQQYPDLEIAAAPTWMSAIAELANGPVHAIIGFVEPSFGALRRAVRGMRTAAGDDVPLVLCCEPAGEPLTRQAVRAGADDYLIWPPDAAELDRVLHLRGSGKAGSGREAREEFDEVAAINELLSGLTSSLHRLPRQMAEFLHHALPASGVEVVVDRSIKRLGPEDVEMVLREPIEMKGTKLGEVALGPALAGAYDARDLARLRRYVKLFARVLDAARQQSHWRHLAMTDELTHLPNRRYLKRFLADVLERAARERFRVTVCMFDIDDFKHYNDAYGHATGDAIIRAMGQLFLRHCRVEDVVARYGGDEFVVVFWDAETPRVAGSEHPDAAIEVMRRFQDSLKSYEFGCLGPKGQGVLTVSGGLATYPWHASTSEGLLKSAGQALLEAKKSGKNQIHVIG